MSARRPPYADLRAASSVYSEDDADQFRQHHQDTLTQFSPDYNTTDSNREYLPLRRNSEISPPDSPISLTRVYDHRSSAEVSPVDEEPPHLFNDGQMDRKLNNHIPAAPKRANTMPMKSDFLASENNSYRSPSHGNSAKKSVGFADMLTKNGPDNAAASTTRQGWAHKSGGLFKHFASRKKAANGNAQPLAAREPWKDPSGRSAVMDPIEEKRVPIHISKSNDRLRGGRDMASMGFVPSVVTTITAGKENLTVPKRRPVRGESSRPERIIPTSAVPPRVDLPKLDDYLDAALAELKIEDRPASRFSATTYESSEADSLINSARGSTSEVDTKSIENLLPAALRDRLMPSPLAAAKTTTRKPTPLQAAQEAASDATPPCPPEKQLEERIAELEARRDSLTARKNNINTVIHELTQVIQPSSIAYDLAVRDEIRKTVASLNNELAEIQKEEHEVGMKLVRAWRRRDERDNNGGGSTLWVRRVTT